jgi:hypothetical protein
MGGKANVVPTQALDTPFQKNLEEWIHVINKKIQNYPKATSEYMAKARKGKPLF